jgi:Restriction endonuclease
MIFDTEPQNWTELQDYVGQMFNECGFETEISKVVELVRGKKEIDVYTQDTKSEYKPIILVECKFWNKPISQETIHSFRTVVADFGANIGFIVSKNGFQKGSYEASKKTNIKLVSLKELEIEYYSKWKQAMVEKYMPYADRLFPYWDYPGKMPKDGGTINFELQQLINEAYEPVRRIGPMDQMRDGFKRNYPIKLPILDDEFNRIGEKEIQTDRQYFDFVEENKDRAFEQFKKLYRE